MGRMAVARRLQLRKVIAGPYAWGALSVPDEVVSYWDRFLYVSGCGALGFHSSNTSHLLVECLSATLSAGALRLREQLRLFLQLKVHCSRRSPMGFPRHASIGLFDAFLEEFRCLGEACPPSWVKGVADRLAAADAIMPFPVPLESLSRWGWSGRSRFGTTSARM
jgi:hypothetical protein